MIANVRTIAETVADRLPHHAARYVVLDLLALGPNGRF